MKKFAPKHGLFALVALLAVLSSLVCAPSPAAADLPYGTSTSDQGTVYYYSVAECIEAATSGVEVSLNRDWYVDSSVEIEAGKTATLDLNSWSVFTTKECYAFKLGNGASLTLYSSYTAEASRTYTGYNTTSSGRSQFTTNRASIISTDGNRNNSGIYMGDGSSLTLENLAINGCFTLDRGGAIYTCDNCTIKATNCDLEHNLAYNGGGIYMGGDSVNVTLDNVKINGNHAYYTGGGISAAGTNASINLKNGTTISNNYAEEGGGGVSFGPTNFHLYNGNEEGASEDLTPTICSNRTHLTNEFCGGGIYVVSSSTESRGTIEGIKICDNISAGDGGGVYLDQHNTTVKNCIISGNSAGRDGGGVFVNDDSNTLDGCTITSNRCDTLEKGYEGGGVFVGYRYDIALTGVTTITDNVRGSNTESTNYDNVFLSTISGSTGFAYITGGVEDGSKVGIRTGIKGERMVGKNITTYTSGTYFSDTDGYWISHGSDHNGDLWQRTGATDFELKINGKKIGRCKPGAKIRLNAETIFRDKVFYKWIESECEGLSPFSEAIPDIYSSTITFTMPQNDVNLVFMEKNEAKDITLTVGKPAAGESFDRTATISWEYNGVSYSKSITLTWIDESYITTDTAKAGKKYRFYAAAGADSWFWYDTSLDASNVKIVWEGEEGGIATQDAHVDSLGRLNLTSDYYETEKPTVTEVDEASGNVTALSSTSGLLAVVPGSVSAKLSDGSTTTLAVDKDNIAWPEGLLDGDEVADVGATAKTYEDIELPLVATDAVPDAANHTCKFTLTVLPSTSIAAPSVSLAGGTYNRYGGSTKLGDDLTLSVTAACSAKDATVYYSVDGGKECAYASAGITLTGEADKSVSRKLQVWAVRDGVKSEVVEATYVLDDTLNKQVEIKCSDTALYAEGEKRWADKLTVTANMGETVSVTAPTEDGRTFDHWEWAEAPKGTDLTQETLQIAGFDPKYSGEITAVYTPVVTAVDLVVDAPVAHGEFATTAAVSVRVGDDETSKDITDYLSERGALAWLTDEETAGHDTCYTATLSLATDSSTDGVKYEIADTPKLLVRGSEVDGGSAYDASSKTLFVTFPSTGAYEYQSVEAVDEVDLSFADAWSYQAAQDEGSTVSWGLPGHVSVSYKCGESEPLDVTWEVTGFDAGATGEQTLTAKGTISFPEYVDNDGAPEYIEATVNVAALETASAPVATPTSGTYRGAQSVTLTCATEGAIIRYTLDGTEPTVDSPAYDGAVTVARSCTLKARAFHNGMLPSGTASYVYVINHVVTFDSAGGSEVESQTVAYGKCAAEPAAPTQAGFAFGGWLDADGNPYDFATPVTGDITLYAQWSASGEPASAHVVTFDSAGGTEVADQVVGDGQCATEPEAPTQAGFEFGGWTTEGGERYDFSSPVTSDLTLYATWSASGEPASACVVTFDTAGGSAVAEQVIATGQCATRPADPTQEGFTFEGWLDESGNEYDFGTPVTQSITLYAQWSASGDPARPWVVTFDTAGGSAVADQAVTPGSCARRPADPANPGFKFEGWFDADGNEYDFSTPVTGDLTLYAQWSASGEPTSAHVVTFDSMGGSEVAEQVVADGACVERPADPTREGYVFTGWCTDEGLNEEYYFGTEVRADLTLYAKWAVKSDDQGGDTDGGDSGKSDGSADDSQPDASGKTNKRGGVLPTTGDALAIASLVAAAGIPLGVAGAFLYRRR